MADLVVLQKPAYGEQRCNRCGICCERELCVTGMEHHRPVEYNNERYDMDNRKGPCPSLIYNEDGSTTCGLWDEVSKWIGLGGCYCTDEMYPWQNTEGRNETRARAELDKTVAKVVR